MKDGGLRLWDLRTLECVQKIAWDGGNQEGAKASSQIYSAKFVNPKKELIIAGGADKYVTKIF